MPQPRHPKPPASTEPSALTLVTTQACFQRRLPPGGANRVDGYGASDVAVAHLSPARFESINPYGAHTTGVATVVNRPGPVRSDGPHG